MSTITPVRLSQPNAYQQVPQNNATEIPGLSDFGKIQLAAAKENLNCIHSSDAAYPISVKIHNLDIPEVLRDTMSLPVFSMKEEKHFRDYNFKKESTNSLIDRINKIENIKSAIDGSKRITHYVQALPVPLKVKETTSIKLYSNRIPTPNNPILAIVSSPSDTNNLRDVNELIVEKSTQEIVNSDGRGFVVSRLQDDRINQGQTSTLNERLKPEELERSMIQVVSISTHVRQTLPLSVAGLDVSDNMGFCDGGTDGAGTDIGQFRTGHKVCHLQHYNKDLVLADREIEVLSLIPIAYDDSDDLIQSLPKIKEIMKQVLAGKQIQI